MIDGLVALGSAASGPDSNFSALVVMVVALLTVLLATVTVFSASRAFIELAARPPVTVAAAASGPVTIAGRGEVASDVRAPISDRDCLGWALHAETRTSKVPLRLDSSTTPFWLVDETGRAMVHPTPWSLPCSGLQASDVITTMSLRELRRAADSGNESAVDRPFANSIDVDAPLHEVGRLRGLREYVLPPGTELVVRGTLLIGADGVRQIVGGERSGGAALSVRGGDLATLERRNRPAVVARWVAIGTVASLVSVLANRARTASGRDSLAEHVTPAVGLALMVAVAYLAVVGTTAMRRVRRGRSVVPGMPID